MPEAVEYRDVSVLAPWESQMAVLEWNTRRWVGRLRYTAGSMRGTVVEMSQPMAEYTLRAFAEQHHCHFQLRVRQGQDWPDAPNFNMYRATRQGV